MRTASSMSTAMSSFDSSLSVLGPPLDRITTPFGNVDGMLERRMPRVHISASAYGQQRHDRQVDALEARSSGPRK